MGPRAILILCAAYACAGAPSASAHDFRVTPVHVLLTRDGRYEITMTVDVDAMAMGAPSSTDSATLAAALRAMTPSELAECVERARQTLAHRVRIRFDEAKQDPTIEFPGGGATTPTDPPTFLGIAAKLSGPIPENAHAFTFGASRAFQTINLSIEDESTGSVAKYTLNVSEDCPPFALGHAQIPQTRTAIALRYLVLGFEHILPKGLDHILFVLGLFLLSTRFKPLLWQVTAFTIAHSFSLAMSIYGVFSLPSSVVEPLIAASIVCIAVENIMTAKLHPWRPAVVFLFGLLHGLGFAGVLRELGLPRSEFVTALVTFNAGVEAGQLTVVATAFCLVGWFRMRDWYRSVVVVPASALIAAVGLFWTIQRLP